MDGEPNPLARHSLICMGRMLREKAKQLRRGIEAQEKQTKTLTLHRPGKDMFHAGRTHSYALRELVKAVYAEAPVISSGGRKQKIRIVCVPIGCIPVDELMDAKEA